MAEKRMYSKKVTDSDTFIEMSASSQALYFHLNQGADDDGFNNQIQLAMLKAHASIDDLKVLITKNFIIRFENGVVVVKHWWIHNTLRKDRYTPTNFQEELKLLGIKDNKSYTLDTENCHRLPSGCQVVTTDKNRVDKISIDKNSIVECNNTTPFTAFCEKYSIICDNYSATVNEIDFSLLDKAYSESKWLRENFLHLSKICKKYNEIICGAFRDFTKKEEKKELNDKEFLIKNGFSEEYVNSLSAEELKNKRDRYENM